MILVVAAAAALNAAGVAAAPSHRELLDMVCDPAAFAVGALPPRSLSWPSRRLAITDGEWLAAVGADGVEMSVEQSGEIAFALPAFEFDGGSESEIACDGRAHDVEMSGDGTEASYSLNGNALDNCFIPWNRLKSGSNIVKAKMRGAK